MNENYPSDDCGFLICDDFEDSMNGLYLYSQGYNNNNDNDNNELKNDEDINELKNDELVRHKRISYSIKLEEIYKRKQESKIPQDFNCNRCFEIWTCAWCCHGFCDDIMSPYKLEGKPQCWSINDVEPEYWKSKTEKEKRKISKKWKLQVI